MQFYTFKNIPYAAPPVGPLRWREPQPPVVNTTLIDGSYGPSCIQTGIGDPKNIQGFTGPTSEDCLYLDVYVPGDALRSNDTKPLPVIHWFYGGGYVYGTKDLYTGLNLLQTSRNSIIFIASNYRLGALGFLGGSTQERLGLPNAGFHDMRAALNWTATHIQLLGGDPANVTAFGESAGAGGILHLITAEGGTLDPFFRHAVLQSPAFDTRWDRGGRVEELFANFSAAAGCSGGAQDEGEEQVMQCLRAADPEKLREANDACAYTPYKERSAVLLSHVRDEAASYVDDSVKTDDDFARYMRYYYPVDAVPEAIAQRYPGPDAENGTYGSEGDRLKDVLAASRFVCNIRFLADALLQQNGTTSTTTRVWNMQYSAPPGTHGADVLPSFFFPSLISTNATADFVDGYRSLLTSLAMAGDPNTFKRNNSIPRIPAWPQMDNSTDAFGNVLDVDLFEMELVSDEQNRRSVCDFWIEVAAAVTNAGGYAPPGSVVGQGLVPENGNASRNFGRWLCGAEVEECC
ncbi:hypothetical protein BFW01_g12706 [Lasiodiplodia theobromae]|nr:hypothetical protein BFW01_g12706 [Lasiodiplodia theobromae]